jgi:pteridine reductase
MLEPKVAFITGGSKRLGRLLSEKLSLMGYRLAIHYNDSIVSGLADDALYFKADFSQAEQVKDCFKQALSACGKIDLLVNSAACFDASPLEDGDLEHTLRHIAVNLTAPILLTQLFAKYCGKGHIINITDAKNGYDRKSVYETSKIALKGFTEKSALELAPNIRVNAIAPGWILNPENVSVQGLKALEKKCPLNRQGKDSEIQEALSFLIENTYITGQSLYIDGGQHCK